jgi:hypothetical protein
MLFSIRKIRDEAAVWAALTGTMGVQLWEKQF